MEGKQRSFAWFVAARDFLGTPGGVSEGRFGFVCAAMPPPAPRDLGFENGFSGEGATALRQPIVNLRWSAPAAEPGTLTRFEIYRGATNLPPVAATNEPPASARVAEMAFRRGHGALRMDGREFRCPGGTNLWGRGFWYAVRTVRETRCGPIASALCPPVFVNLRRYEAPDAPTGELGLNCPRVVVQRPHENVVSERVDPPVLRRAAVSTGRATPRPRSGLGGGDGEHRGGRRRPDPVPADTLREEDDSGGLRFQPGTDPGEIFAPLVQVVAGAFSGAVERTVAARASFPILRPT